MPYIKSGKMRVNLTYVALSFRYYLDPTFCRKNIKGHLNYLLFKIAKDYCENYKDYSDFIGELESAKLEIYRRLVAPYEDEKIKENGDVE